jgi:hypothetical protein
MIILLEAMSFKATLFIVQVFDMGISDSIQTRTNLASEIAEYNTPPTVRIAETQDKPRGYKVNIN